VSEKIGGEDFQIECRSPNRFKFFGTGFTPYELDDTNDMAFYVEKCGRLEVERCLHSAATNLELVCLLRVVSIVFIYRLQFRRNNVSLHSTRIRCRS
jgi:hypothetical protein